LAGVLDYLRLHQDDAVARPENLVPEQYDPNPIRPQDIDPLRLAGRGKEPEAVMYPPARRHRPAASQVDNTSR
jgi:hypothetical protein